MINGFLKTIASLLMLCIVVSFASRRNDGDDEELGGGTTGQPPVITFDNGTGIYTVRLWKASQYHSPSERCQPIPYMLRKDEKGKIVCTEPHTPIFTQSGSGEVYQIPRGRQEWLCRRRTAGRCSGKMIPSVSLTSPTLPIWGRENPRIFR